MPNTGRGGTALAPEGLGPERKQKLVDDVRVLADRARPDVQPGGGVDAPPPLGAT